MPIFVWFLGKVVVMAKKRVLFISQEIVPYLPESDMANIGRFLPQGIHDKGKEIRTFIYGSIGAGFFVQNAMRSTTSGVKRYLVTCLSL